MSPADEDLSSVLVSARSTSSAFLRRLLSFTRFGRVGPVRKASGMVVMATTKQGDVCRE